MKRTFGSLMKGINVLSRIVGGGVIVVTLIFIIWQFYLFLFYPVNVPINAQITDFEKMGISSKTKCNETLNIDYLEEYPLQLNLSDSNPYFNDYYVESSVPFNFDIAFDNSDYEFTFEPDNKSQSVSKGTLDESKKWLKGTAHEIRIGFQDVESIDMFEAICAPKIELIKSDSTYSTQIKYEPGSESYNVIRTLQKIPADSEVIITLVGPITLNEQPNVSIEKIAIRLRTKKDISNLFVGIEGYDFSADLPDIEPKYDEKTDTFPINNWNSFSIGMMNVGNIEFTAPVGKIQFGAYPEIILTAPVGKIQSVPYPETIGFDPFTPYSNITLEIPSPFEKNFDTSDLMQFESNLSNGSFTINGTIPKIIYRRKAYETSRWQKLPGEIQAVLVSVLLSLIGGVWTFRRSIRRWLQSLFPILKPSESYLMGKYVFIMKSGVVIAGELSRKPASKQTYYKVENARRKVGLSGEWENEVIAEIKIRADAVEHYYVA